MTDPRIIPCAKALARLHGHILDTPAYMEYVDSARVCVLMWIQQEPTTEMLAAIARCVSRGDTSARAALSCYTDIQAAARAEIAK